MHPFGRHRRSGADQGQGRRLEAQGEFLITADWKVELDSDVDLWVVGPEKKPLFYGSREVGCASLDRDSLGYSTSLITLADGSVAQAESNKETTTIRCIAPGHYDVGVNLYADAVSGAQLGEHLRSANRCVWTALVSPPNPPVASGIRGFRGAGAKAERISRQRNGC